MSDFNTGIIENFRANKGNGEFDGVPLILIHHIGAKSGRESVNPVVCCPQSGGRLLIIAGNGGAPTSPDWYYNLKAHPTIKVEFGGETFVVAVRELEGRERDNAWSDALNTAPQLGGMQKKTTRTIPVLLLTRTP
jgi:deazaflavin-dependent oxidoreductase (nitroreductase family)